MPERSPTGKDSKSLRERAAEEHRQLQRLLRGLDTTEQFADLTARLEALQPQLDQHFGLEEIPGDGLLDAVETRAVHLHSELEKLREDHQRLRAEILDLCARARTCPAAKQDALRADVAVFVEHLHDHEMRETRVFMDAWNTDLGAQD